MRVAPAFFTLAICLGQSAQALMLDFEKEKLGEVASGFECGVSGEGTPKWVVDTEPKAPSGSRVLKQIGEGTFPWCYRKDLSITDGTVEVSLKTVQGKYDQAAGVIWRFKDARNYSIARANPLEDNVAIFQMVNGKRKTIKFVDLTVAPKKWHKLKVE